MMDDLQRLERDPAAIQIELMSIDKQIEELAPELQEKNEAYQQARAMFEVDKLRLKLLKERRTSLQSVLKSLR